MKLDVNKILKARELLNQNELEVVYLAIPEKNVKKCIDKVK